ncbi:MAG: T9SS type A sorting domain-containing protein [Calditrichia bacterium]
MKSLFTVVAVLVLFLAFAGNVSGQGHVDPPYLQITSAENPITVDGVLDETDWARRYDMLVFRDNFKPGDVEYDVTGNVLVQGTYTDTTTTYVRILHYGLDLYISLQSDDESVGKFGTSWEGDGLFMKIADAGGTQVEYKLYFNLGGTDPDIAFEQPGLYPGSGAGAAWKHPSTIANDTTAADSGYTAEMVIHLDQLGYTSADTDIPVLINIFDPDGYMDNMDPYGTKGAYYKSWWGSEWGPDTRILRLADPALRTAYKTTESIALDGQLNEGFWTGAESVTVGKGSSTSTGGYYMQWGNANNEYTDQSMANVKFMHNGTDLYVGFESNDSSVCEWSPGWEADGLFLWMTFKDVIPGSGDRMEVKLMYFGNTVGSPAEFQLSASVPTGGAEGASYEPEGTMTHTESNGPDHGYSGEVVVHTDLFGYSEGDTVKLSVVIWDLDYSSADVFSQDLSDYAPNWWGAQWVDPTFEKYFMYRDVVLSPQASGINDKPAAMINSFSLEQNYPNPFNPATHIRYNLPVTTTLTVEVYNILGKKVATLFEGKQNAGAHTLIWNGTDNAGSRVASGVYFYKMSSPEFTQIKKMMLLK